MIREKGKPVESFRFSTIKRNVPKMLVKRFTVPIMYTKTKKKALCQVEKCKEEGAWIVPMKKGKSVLLCFSHGEET